MTELLFDRCWCGNILQTKLDRNRFCVTHGSNYMFKPKENPKEPKIKIGRYSGRSRSPNAWNDYQ